MPLAGVAACSVVGAGGLFLKPGPECMVLFVATGSIIYLGLFFSRLTGEKLTDCTRPKNVFDALFMHSVAQAVLVYAIALPFFSEDYSSLPLSVASWPV